MQIERRSVMAAPQVRADEAGKKIGGYAAIFNSDADIGGYWIERIAPGAFADSVDGDVRALFDHDHGRIIGRTKAGTLRLTEDDKGLAVEIDLPDTSDGRDVGVLIERGDLSGMSFGFVVTKQEWDETVDPPVRTIEKVDLHEVSVVAFPAYDETEIALRSSKAVVDQRQRAKNFNGASKRLGMKMDLDLRTRAGR